MKSYSYYFIGNLICALMAITLFKYESFFGFVMITFQFVFLYLQFRKDKKGSNHDE